MEICLWNLFKINNKVVLVSLLLTLNRSHTLLGVNIVNFEQVNIVNFEPVNIVNFEEVNTVNFEQVNTGVGNGKFKNENNENLEEKKHIKIFLQISLMQLNTK